MVDTYSAISLLMSKSSQVHWILSTANSAGVAFHAYHPISSERERFIQWAFFLQSEIKSTRSKYPQIVLLLWGVCWRKTFIDNSLAEIKSGKTPSCCCTRSGWSGKYLFEVAEWHQGKSALIQYAVERALKNWCFQYLDARQMQWTNTLPCLPWRSLFS